jgi:hypothetical protein
MITFETITRINPPIEEVFAYVSEPRNFPRWNSAVQAVRKTSADHTSVASTYLMERALPIGRAVNELEVVMREWPREFAIRTRALCSLWLENCIDLVAAGATMANLDPRLVVVLSSTFVLDSLPDNASWLVLAKSRASSGVEGSRICGFLPRSRAVRRPSTRRCSDCEWTPIGTIRASRMEPVM